MKSFLTITNIIAIAVIAFLCWNGNCRQPNKETVKVLHDTIYVDGKPKPSQICVECETETDGQTFNHFKNVVQNYRTKIWDSINNTTRFVQPTLGKSYNDLTKMYNNTDARCIWFPLETIKKFVCTIEKYNKQLITPQTNLGIRLYYGVYEDDYEEDKEKQGRHTLFMLPTYAADGGPQTDFDPRETYFQQQNLNGNFKEIMNYVNILQRTPTASLKSKKFLMVGGADKVYDPVSKSTMTTTASSTTSLIQNTGEICPKNCPSTNTFQLIDP